jgi:hypothetical protein
MANYFRKFGLENRFLWTLATSGLSLYGFVKESSDSAPGRGFHVKL